MAAGNAAIGAAQAARSKLLALAAVVLEAQVDDLELADGQVRVRGTDRAAGMAELARQHIWRHGGEGIQVSHTWDAQTQMHDAQLHGNIAPAYSFAAPGSGGRGRYGNRPGPGCLTAMWPTTAARR